MDKIVKLIRETYPKAVSVKLFINAESYDLEVKTLDNADYSMKTLNGQWAEKNEN